MIQKPCICDRGCKCQYCDDPDNNNPCECCGHCDCNIVIAIPANVVLVPMLTDHIFNSEVCKN